MVSDPRSSLPRPIRSVRTRATSGQIVHVVERAASDVQSCTHRSRRVAAVREAEADVVRRSEIALVVVIALGLAVQRIVSAATSTPVRMFDSA